MKTFIYTFSLAFLSFISFGQIYLTEIMYNPPEAGTDTLEYLELYNRSTSPVEMTGWRFSEGINFTFPEFVLAPESYITLCVRESAFKAVFGEDIPVIQWQSRGLVNGGELLELRNLNDEIVFSVTYRSGANGWYTEADGNGASIELCNLDGNPNNKENWRPSQNALGVVINERELFGTPGEENSTSCDIAADHIIEVRNFFFSPAELTIQPGEIVRWINLEGSHNVNGSQGTFPNNPESFGSGVPQSGNWTYDFQFNTPGVYRYRCNQHPNEMQGTITVEGEVNPEVPLYPIGTLRGVNAQGVADSLGVTCAVVGQVYGVNIRPAGQGFQFTLIDNDGDGIGVFSPVNDFGYTVREGDEVRIEGVVEQFRGLLQMNVSNFELISTGNPNIMPVTVAQLGEETENRLITITGVSVVNPSQWTNAAGGFNVTVTDGNRNFEMRIARNVMSFTEAPVGTFNLTGIGGQFSNTTAPFLDGYQILPRYAADFDFSVSTQESSAPTFKIYPNPANQELFIEQRDIIRFCEIYDMNGRVLKIESINDSQGRLVVSDLTPGIYIVRLFSVNGVQSMPIQILR